MAFRGEVEYLDDYEPEYMILNGLEYERVARLTASVLPELTAAPAAVDWVSTAKDLYAVRLQDTISLAEDLRTAFATAGPALVEYGERLAWAKACLDAGDTAAKALAKQFGLLKALYPVPDREPMEQWDYLKRASRSVMDPLFQEAFAKIRPAAEGHYRAAATAYEDALRFEKEGRAECLAEMFRAWQKLPDFRADSNLARLIVQHTPGLAREMAEAAALDSDVRLSGQGTVPPFGVDGGNLSGLHAHIRDEAHSFGLSGPTWGTGDFIRWNTPLPGESEHDFKLRWIRAYAPLIQKAAEEYGLPAEVLAGVIYQEVGGKPLWFDDASDKARRILPPWLREPTPLRGDPDDTSYGPLAVQVDTAARALGYDPDALTPEQREEIVTSLKDPKQNILITAKVLADGKDTTGFALTDPDQMTPEERKRLAEIYNGGPGSDSPHAREYADNYAEHEAEAAQAAR